MSKSVTQKGFTVLLAILIAAIVLSIGLAILGIVMKQLKLTGIARESEVAFQAANGGLECIRYFDVSSIDGNKFDVDSLQSTISCMGATINTRNTPSSAQEQLYEWTWGDASQVCSSVSIYKFYDDTDSVDVEIGGVTYRTPCPPGVECTVIKARGYNSECGLLTRDRTVERELTVVY